MSNRKKLISNYTLNGVIAVVGIIIMVLIGVVPFSNIFLEIDINNKTLVGEAFSLTPYRLNVLPTEVYGDFVGGITDSATTLLCSEGYILNAISVNSRTYSGKTDLTGITFRCSKVISNHLRESDPKSPLFETKNWGDYTHVDLNDLGDEDSFIDHLLVGRKSGNIQNTFITMLMFGRRGIDIDRRSNEIIIGQFNDRHYAYGSHAVEDMYPEFTSCMPVLPDEETTLSQITALAGIKVYFKPQAGKNVIVGLTTICRNINMVASTLTPILNTRLPQSIN